MGSLGIFKKKFSVCLFRRTGDEKPSWMPGRNGTPTFIGIACCHLLLLFFQAEIGMASIPQKNVQCDGCHGLYPGMRGEGGGGGGGGTVQLGNEVCVDCHSYSGSGTTKILGGVRVPVVYNYVPPGSPLAGGNFYYLNLGMGNAGGHNVDGAAPPDINLNGIPPGYYRSTDPSLIGFDINKPLYCAGSNGCHGDRNIENPFDAISGSHHAGETPMDGSTTARSYRFLKNTSATTGVIGLEDIDWGQNATSLKHNEYDPSIIDLCVSCHGIFHVPGNTGWLSPWLMHPVGIALPDRGEFADYNPDAGALAGGERQYSLNAPLARPFVPSASSDMVYPGTDLLTCLSCHSAHGTPNQSMLRWDYNAIEAGKAAGTPHAACLICHTQK